MEATKTEVKTRLGRVLRAAIIEPVVITAHGEPSHVLVSIEQWNELQEKLSSAKSDARTPDKAMPQQPTQLNERSS